MNRRELITLVGGAAVSPLSARAQHGDRVRRVGVLLLYDERDREGQTNVATLRKSLHELGWAEGRNIRIDDRWSAGDSERMRSFAIEFAGIAPDVVVGISTPVLHALQREIRSIPIVFL